MSYINLFQFKLGGSGDNFSQRLHGIAFILGGDFIFSTYLSWVAHYDVGI